MPFIPPFIEQLIRYHQQRADNYHQIVGKEPPDHHGGIEIVLGKIIAEEGGKAYFLCAGGAGHGHKGHGNLQQALYGENLPIADTPVSKGKENEIDHAHLQQELGNGKQYAPQDAALIFSEGFPVAAEIRLKFVDGVQQMEVVPQELKTVHQPLGKTADGMEHRLDEQAGKKDDGAAVYDKPQNDKRNDAWIFHGQLAVHAEEAHQRAEEKRALEAEEFYDQHGGGNANGDFIPPKVCRLHGLSTGGAGGDVGIVDTDDPDFHGAADFHGDILAAHEQADDTTLEQKINYGNHHGEN